MGVGRNGNLKPAEKGNKRAVGNHGGRPRKDLAGLADDACELVLRDWLKRLENPRLGAKERHWLQGQIAMLTKGRVPKKLELTGAEGGPVEVKYVDIERLPARDTPPATGEVSE